MEKPRRGDIEAEEKSKPWKEGNPYLANNIPLGPLLWQETSPFLGDYTDIQVDDVEASRGPEKQRPYPEEMVVGSDWQGRFGLIMCEITTANAYFLDKEPFQDEDECEQDGDDQDGQDEQDGNDQDAQDGNDQDEQDGDRVQDDEQGGKRQPLTIVRNNGQERHGKRDGQESDDDEEMEAYLQRQAKRRKERGQ